MIKFNANNKDKNYKIEKIQNNALFAKESDVAIYQNSTIRSFKKVTQEKKIFRS